MPACCSIRSVPLRKMQGSGFAPSNCLPYGTLPCRFRCCKYSTCSQRALPGPGALTRGGGGLHRIPITTSLFRRSRSTRCTRPLASVSASVFPIRDSAMHPAVHRLALGTPYPHRVGHWRRRAAPRSGRSRRDLHGRPGEEQARRLEAPRGSGHRRQVTRDWDARPPHQAADCPAYCRHHAGDVPAGRARAHRPRYCRLHRRARQLRRPPAA